MVSNTLYPRIVVECSRESGLGLTQFPVGRLWRGYRQRERGSLQTSEPSVRQLQETELKGAQGEQLEGQGA